MKHHLNEDLMPHPVVTGLSVFDRFWNWANAAVESLLKEPLRDPSPYQIQRFLRNEEDLNRREFLLHPTDVPGRKGDFYR